MEGLRWEIRSGMVRTGSYSKDRPTCQQGQVGEFFSENRS